MMDAGKRELNASMLTWRRQDKCDMNARSPRDQAETLVVIKIGTRGADDSLSRLRIEINLWPAKRASCVITDTNTISTDTVCSL